MKYPDGQEAKLGDQVELWSGNQGMVVCSIDAGEYAADTRRSSGPVSAAAS